MKQCPKCKKFIKQLNPKHIKKCFGDDMSYKIQYINYNFPLTENSQLLKKLYIDDEYSIPMLCKEVGGLDLKSMCYVLKYYNIKTRTVKETRQLREYKNRLESTNKERYGAINPLCKGTKPWEKRNKTVSDKYGVENVWQCISDFVSEFGHRSKFSKLNIRINKILNESSLEFEAEFRIKYNIESKIKWKFYDFRIGNYLLEINGDYWHANPSLYNKNHVFYFPKKILKAKDIWEIDKYKKQIANQNGYEVLYLWESNINKMSDDEILQYIKNQIN